MDLPIGERYQIILYVDTACLAAVVWDLLCLLPQEIDLVWKGRWNLIKSLYMVLRLFPVATFVAQLTVWDIPTSQTVPHIPLPPRSTLVCFNLVFVEAFLGLRVHAIWNGNRAITIVIMASLALVIASAFTVGFVPYTFAAYAVYYSLFSMFYILMLVLTIIQAKHSMPHHRRTRLLRIVYRDGILYYLVILPLLLVEVIGFSMSATCLLPIIFQRIIPFVSSVLAARITISMKAAHNNRVPQTLQLSELVLTAEP